MTGPMRDAVAVARASLAADGFEYLAPLVHGVAGARRPCRPLDRDEAMAMLRAWRAAYAPLPVCRCPVEACPPCPIGGECRPDFDDERYVAQTLEYLGRPVGRHVHFEGERCTWPATVIGGPPRMRT